MLSKRDPNNALRDFEANVEHNPTESIKELFKQIGYEYSDEALAIVKKAMEKSGDMKVALLGSIEDATIGFTVPYNEENFFAFRRCEKSESVAEASAILAEINKIQEEMHASIVNSTAAFHQESANDFPKAVKKVFDTLGYNYSDAAIKEVITLVQEGGRYLTFSPPIKKNTRVLTLSLGIAEKQADGFYSTLDPDVTNSLTHVKETEIKLQIKTLKAGEVLKGDFRNIAKVLGLDYSEDKMSELEKSGSKFFSQGQNDKPHKVVKLELQDEDRPFIHMASMPITTEDIVKLLASACQYYKTGQHPGIHATLIEFSLQKLVLSSVSHADFDINSKTNILDQYKKFLARDIKEIQDNLILGKVTDLGATLLPKLKNIAAIVNQITYLKIKPPIKAKPPSQSLAVLGIVNETCKNLNDTDRELVNKLLTGFLHNDHKENEMNTITLSTDKITKDASIANTNKKTVFNGPKKIRNNNVILEYTGEKISKTECAQRADKSYIVAMPPHNDLDAVSEYIDGINSDSGAGFVNCSQTPNCTLQADKDGIFLRATQDIKPGEQLVFNYGLHYKLPTKIAIQPHHSFDCASQRFQKELKHYSYAAPVLAADQLQKCLNLLYELTSHPDAGDILFVPRVMFDAFANQLPELADDTYVNAICYRGKMNQSGQYQIDEEQVELSALMVAAHLNDASLASKLLNLGADPRRYTHAFKTPLTFLIENTSIPAENKRKLLDTLLEEGVDPTIADHDDLTVVHTCIAQCNKVLLSPLLRSLTILDLYEFKPCLIAYAVKQDFLENADNNRAAFVLGELKKDLLQAYFFDVVNRFISVSDQGKDIRVAWNKEKDVYLKDIYKVFLEKGFLLFSYLPLLFKKSFHFMALQCLIEKCSNEQFFKLFYVENALSAQGEALSIFIHDFSHDSIRKKIATLLMNKYFQADKIAMLFPENFSLPQPKTNTTAKLASVFGNPSVITPKRKAIHPALLLTAAERSLRSRGAVVVPEPSHGSLKRKRAM